ncbi:hypothetical protein JCM9957A_15350 [Kineosporia succinea]
MQEILSHRTARRTVGAHVRKRGTWGVLAVLVLAVVLALGGLRLTGVVGGSTEEERRAAALAKRQDDLRPQVEALMQARAAFFAGERRYLPAMKQARTRIERYNAKLADVEQEIDDISRANSSRLSTCHFSCSDLAGLDYPDYPRPPKMAGPVDDLQRVARRMTELHDELLTARRTAGMEMAFSDLLGAVDLLGQDARENLASIDEMSRTAKDGVYGGGSRRLRVRTLNGNSSLTAIRQMNSNLVRFLESAQLPIEGLDLPGGKDKFRTDHSVSTAEA